MTSFSHPRHVSCRSKKGERKKGTSREYKIRPSHPFPPLEEEGKEEKLPLSASGRARERRTFFYSPSSLPSFLHLLLPQLSHILTLLSFPFPFPEAAAAAAAQEQISRELINLIRGVSFLLLPPSLPLAGGGRGGYFTIPPLPPSLLPSRPFGRGDEKRDLFSPSDQFPR